MTLSWRVAFALSAIIAPNAGAAFGSEEYPSKVIRIVTSEPGSTNDLVARMVARGLSANLGQTIVENRGGISPEYVARSAAPDGYTILFFGNAAWLSPLFRKMSYDGARDLAPISTGCSQPTILAVHPSMPVKTVKEFIALAKARPGEINYGTGVTITGPLLAAELFKRQAKVDIVRINYRGTGPAAVALASGEVQVMFVGAGTAMPHIRAGRIRGLAVTTPEPSSLVPGLPSVSASGLPGYEYTSFIGFQAPGRTPPAIVNRLSQKIVEVLKSEDVRSKLVQSGVEAGGTTPEVFAAKIKAEIGQWQRIIEESGLRFE